MDSYNIEKLNLNQDWGILRQPYDWLLNKWGFGNYSSTWSLSHIPGLSLLVVSTVMNFLLPFPSQLLNLDFYQAFRLPVIQVWWHKTGTCPVANKSFLLVFRCVCVCLCVCLCVRVCVCVCARRRTCVFWELCLHDNYHGHNMASHLLWRSLATRSGNLPRVDACQGLWTGPTPHHTHPASSRVQMALPRRALGRKLITCIHTRLC